MQFTDWAVQARTVYCPQLHSLRTGHFVNCHSAHKAMFYLLNDDDKRLKNVRKVYQNCCDILGCGTFFCFFKWTILVTLEIVLLHGKRLKM